MTTADELARKARDFSDYLPAASPVPAISPDYSRILAALMCRGHMRQLRGHIGHALDLGMSRREISEVFSQAGWYRGWPCVEEALEEADAVFKERWPDGRPAAAG